MIRKVEEGSTSVLEVTNWKDWRDGEKDIAAAVNEVERCYRDQSVLYSLMERLGGERDVQRICRIAVEEARDALEASTALLLLSDQTTGELYVKSAAGVYADMAWGFRILPEVGIIGRSLRNRKALAAHYLASENSIRFPFPVNYLVCIPMVAPERTLGVMIVCDQKFGGEFFTPEIKLASALGSYVASTLSSAFLNNHNQVQFETLSEAERMLEQYREKLVHADKMASLSFVVGTATHEISNFLAAIIGTARLSEESDLDPDRRSSYENILRAAEGIRDLLQEMRNYSKKSDPSQRPIDIKLPIDGAIGLIEKYLIARNIRVVADLDSDLPQILGNANRLQQVFLNLIQNASHAVDGDGGRLQVSAEMDGDGILVTVSDTGCGIPDESLGKIFDAFFTSRSEGDGDGTGLGLTICRGIIEEHNGTIKVESRMGVGTKFMLRFPALRSDSENAEPLREFAVSL